MTNKRQFLKDYKKPEYNVNKVNLYFNLHETKTEVTAQIEFSQLEKVPLRLNGENLKLKFISLNDRELKHDEYLVEESFLTIFNPPENFLLTTKVEINPEDNKSCEGLYLSSGIFCTQCEAESFRKITYFLDRPDVMTSYTVEIEADKKKYPLLLSNGDCISKKDLSNQRHYAKWIDPFKKPSYLFALVAGDLGVVTDQFTTRSGRNIKLEVFAPHGKQARCLHAMKSLKESMKWDEDTYGLEYDLNQYMIVSIDDFNMGAMENKGLNIFNSRLVLADEKTATDTDFHQIQSVIGHEYFHNWSGNRVTCRNWFELSLKEGLTVFRDQEFSGDMTSRSVQRLHDVDSLRLRQFAEDAGPNAHAVRPESCLSVDNFYTATIYEKGAEVIRMMQTLLGREGFKKGLALYFKKFDGQAVTIDDFSSAMSEANGIDLTQFKLWYSQAGTPLVTVKESYDESSKTYQIDLTQSCPLTVSELESKIQKKPFVIPLKFGIIFKDGSSAPLSTDLLVLNQENQSWTFKNIHSKPILSINREFSACIKLAHDITIQDSLSLIKYDTDSFNRREACSKILLEETRRLINCYKKKEELKVNSEIIEALGYILKDDKIDPQMKSLMLTMPSNLLIAQEENLILPEAFFLAKNTLVKDFVLEYKKTLLDMYKLHQDKNSIGDRALKNQILNFLSIEDEQDSLNLYKEQFQKSQNMTDKIAALEILWNSQSSYKQIAMDEFYNEWSHDSVVLNKWLVIQASAVRNNNTFENVKAATQRAGYDKNNPNNLYSLHRVFSNNFLHFHSSTGLPYTWYADEIIRVDQFNPQVAARLATGFSLTKKLPSDQVNLATEQIKRILSTKNISKNTQELLEKCI